MRKPLRIAVGIEIFYPKINGLVTTTMNMLHELQKLGHEPFIITPRVDSNCGDFEIIENIPVHYIPSTPVRFLGIGREMYQSLGLRYTNRSGKNMIASLLQKKQCDMVHITAPWLTCKTMLKAAKKLAIPRVHTFHTNLYDEKYMRYLMPYGGKHVMQIIRSIVWFIITSYISLSDVITTPSTTVFQILKKKFPKSTITYISNGIDVEALQQEDTALLAQIAPEVLSRKGRYGVFIGRMGQEKSVDILLKAISHMVSDIPDFIFFLIGDGLLTETYRSLAHKLYIRDNVRFLGQISSTDIKKSGIVKHARFFSTASISEVQSMTVIEAICSHTPQVLADHPSMTELAKDSALYAKPGDPVSLSNAMCTMLTNDTIYDACKRAAIAMSASFDGTEVAKKFLKLYESYL